MLSALEVRFPALRTLLGSDELREVRFAAEYLRPRRGPGCPAGLGFSSPHQLCGSVRTVRRTRGASLRGQRALAARRAPSISGPWPAPGTELVDPGRLFPGDATLLGFALKDLGHRSQGATEDHVCSPARPSADGDDGMEERQTLKSSGAFQATGQSTLDMTVTTSAPAATPICSLRDFALVLPSPSNPALKLRFASLTFTHHSGENHPRIEVGEVEVEFLGVLQLLRGLGEAVHLGDLTRTSTVTPAGLVARFSLPLPPVTAGAFTMLDLAVNTDVAVPFDGRPVSVAFGFASRQNPFRLAVLMFGGGGYLELELDHTGLRRPGGGIGLRRDARRRFRGRPR